MDLSQKISEAVQSCREGGVDEFRLLTDLVKEELTVEQLEELLESEEVILLRVAIDLLLKDSIDDAMAKRLRKFSEHENNSVRNQLALSLRSLENAQPHLELLLTLIQDDPSHYVRQNSLITLGSFDSSHDILRKCLHEDASWEVRLEAVRILNKIEPFNLHQPYFEVLARDDDSDVRFEVAKKLNGYFEEHETWPQSIELPKISVLNKALENLPDSPALKHVKSWVTMCTETEFDATVLEGFGTVITLKETLENIPHAWNSEDPVSVLFEKLTGDPSQSVVLLGESGSGKTAIINELAFELAQADPPWCLVQVPPSGFLQDTRYLGEWETRLTNLIKACSAPKRVILYVPSIHELNTVGRSSSSDNNVASALTPFLERGEIRILGETTERQLQEDFVANPTFKRLLSPMTLLPADDEVTREIIFSVLKENDLEPTDTFVDRLVELSEFSQADTVNPGKTVGLLRQVLQQHTDLTKLPSDRDILQAIGNATGVSTDLLDDKVSLDFKKIRNFFESKVIGQPEAVNAAIDLVTLIKARLTDPDKPFGVNLFVGPTGVGKTELAKALAEYCFGDVNRLSRLDMSEFASYDSFERLNGSNGRPGMLTSIVRKQPFSIILLDEIEKANINVFDLCLQIFDAGRLTDGQGRTADFRRSIIIMTSNVGAKISKISSVGFGQPVSSVTGDNDLETHIHSELGHTFRPEFLNRIDRIVLFRPLSENTAEKIARLEVDRVLKRPGVIGRKLAVNIDQAVFPLLVREGYSRAFGARPLKRVIERLVLLPVARKLAAGKIPAESVINISAGKRQLAIEITKPPETAQQPDAPQSDEAIALQEIIDRIAVLIESNTHLSARKSMLLRRTSNPGFWDNREEAELVSEEIRQIEETLKQLEWLQENASNLSDEQVSKEEIIHLNLRTKILEHLANNETETVRNDVFVSIKLLSQRGEPAHGMRTLARMYEKLAQRYHLSFEVIADQKFEKPDEDSLVLKISGIGASLLLHQETGMHEIKRRNSQTDALYKDRELLEVDVIADQWSQEGIDAEDVVIDIQPLSSEKGRLIPKLNWDVRMMHSPTFVSIRVHTDGEKATIQDRLLPLLKARVCACKEPQREDHTKIIRTYELGPSGIIKDHRTGQRSGRVDHVFQGHLDKFVVIPEPILKVHQES